MRFAQILNGVVHHIFTADARPSFAANIVIVDIPDDVIVTEGFCFVDGVFSPPDSPKLSSMETLRQIERTITNRRLREAVLTPEGADWLAEKEAEIASIRAILNSDRRRGGEPPHVP